MGLENRDYLRDSGYESPLRPPPRSLSVVGWLIAANVVVFLLQLLARSSDGRFWLEEALVLTVDDAVFRMQIWRVLTYAFCHSRDQLFHIVFNMMTLHVASQLVLTVLREKELLWVYLGGAVFAGCISLVFYAIVAPNSSMLGASGAVLTCLTLAAIYHPRQQLLLMGVFPVQIRWLLIGFIILDVMPLLSGGWRESGTAHSAHLGGVLFAFLYHLSGFSFSDCFSSLQRESRLRKSGGRLRVYSPEQAGRQEAEVDRILSKISESGEGSLTAAERRTLSEASRQLRKRNSGN